MLSFYSHTSWSKVRNSCQNSEMKLRFGLEGHVWSDPFSPGGDRLAGLIHRGWVLFPQPFLVSPRGRGRAPTRNEDEGLTERGRANLKEQEEDAAFEK